MLAIIIINYNTWEATIRCINSIKNTNTNYKIYIVDNNSQNNSLSKLKEELSSNDTVEIIALETNLGYAKGNNLAAKRAIEDGCEILLISNNDIIYPAGSIDILYSRLKNNMTLACVVPLSISPMGVPDSLPYVKCVSDRDYILGYTRVGRFLSLFIKNRVVEYKWDKEISTNDCISVYKFSGCCFMIRSEAFRDVGMFDDHTFLYFEEDILCKKMHDSGYLSLFCPDIKVTHDHGLSTGKDTFLVDKEMFFSEMYYYTQYTKMSKIKLSILFFDRAVTPLVRRIKGKYKISWKEYLAMLSRAKTYIK